jgi:hypothetical protein
LFFDIFQERTLSNLSISLKGEKVDWIAKFIEIGGPNVLVDLLKSRVIKRQYVNSTKFFSL